VLIFVSCSVRYIIFIYVNSSDATIFLSGSPSSLSGIRFLKLLEEDEMAFDNLFCIAFQMMDGQWLAKRATYMEFNVM